MSTEPIFGQPVYVSIRRALQRFRWFNASFEHEAAAKKARTGIDLVTSQHALARVFLDWRSAFVAQRPHDPSERERFVGFAAGLMLRSMIRYAPVTCVSLPDDCDVSDPVGFWPEGHLYVTYCLSMRAAILKEEFGHRVIQSPEFEDIRAWQSFRENMAEDPALAIPFLDLFAGETPNWTARDIFSWNRGTNVVELGVNAH